MDPSPIAHEPTELLVGHPKDREQLVHKELRHHLAVLAGWVATGRGCGLKFAPNSASSRNTSSTVEEDFRLTARG